MGSASILQWRKLRGREDICSRSYTQHRYTPPRLTDAKTPDPTMTLHGCPGEMGKPRHRVGFAQATLQGKENITVAGTFAQVTALRELVTRL